MPTAPSSCRPQLTVCVCVCVCFVTWMRVDADCSQEKGYDADVFTTHESGPVEQTHHWAWCTPGEWSQKRKQEKRPTAIELGAYRSYVTSSSGHRLTPVSGVWARQSRSTISGRRSRRTSPPCIVRKTAGCAALWSLLKSSYRTTGASSSRLTTRSTGAYAKSSAPSRKRCAPARIGRHAPLLPRIH